MEEHDRSDSYSERQSTANAEYRKGWAEAPEEFKIAAAMKGLHPDVEQTEGEALEYDPTRKENPIVYDEDRFGTGSHTPDMASAIDDYVDEIIEKRGIQHAILIRSVANDLKLPIEKEQFRFQSLLLGRVCSYLVCDEGGNIRARIHSLLHAIPRMAESNKLPSMRESAKLCGVSPEWMRRSRDRWCDVLGVDAPASGVKSDEAKAKYSKNARENHWRHQQYKQETKPNE